LSERGHPVVVDAGDEVELVDAVEPGVARDVRIEQLGVASATKLVLLK
jgi:hypothetical protein